MGLKLQDVPASAGLRWVKQGVAEYFRSPMSYTGLFVTFLLIYIAVLALSSLLAAAIPPFAYLGGLVLLMGVPLLTLAFQMGTESSLRGRVLSAAIYLAPWRQKEPDRRRALLVLLLTYALLTIALFELTSLIDGGAFDALMAAASQGGATEEELARLGAAPGAMAGFVWRAAFTVLLSIPFWCSGAARARPRRCSPVHWPSGAHGVPSRCSRSAGWAPCSRQARWQASSWACSACNWRAWSSCRSL